MATLLFNVSAEAINRIAAISALLERHNIAIEYEYGLKLRKANRIKTIHASLAISLSLYILSLMVTDVWGDCGSH